MMNGKHGSAKKVGNVINLHFEGNWMPIQVMLSSPCVDPICSLHCACDANIQEEVLKGVCTTSMHAHLTSCQDALLLPPVREQLFNSELAM